LEKPRGGGGRFTIIFQFTGISDSLDVMGDERFS